MIVDQTIIADSGGTQADVTAANALKVDGSAVTQPVSLPSIPAGSNNIGDVDVLSLPALPAGTNNIGDVDVLTLPVLTPPSITKGTQGSTGFTVQNLKDAGRTTLRYYATAAAAGATTVETAVTLTQSSDTSATSTAVSFVIPSGKTFRIEAIVFAARGHNTATVQVTTFRIRINTAGAVTTTSTPIILAMRCPTPLTANALDRVSVPLPDGMEIVGDGTLQWGVTTNATFTTNGPTHDVTIIGYLY